MSSSFASLSNVSELLLCVRLWNKHSVILEFKSIFLSCGAYCYTTNWLSFLLSFFEHFYLVTVVVKKTITGLDRP
jgi:hypothetical protein